MHWTQKFLLTTSPWGVENKMLSYQAIDFSDFKSDIPNYLEDLSTFSFAKEVTYNVVNIFHVIFFVSQ